MSEVIVVGGGVIGLTTAWELASHGVSVTVLDQSLPGSEASWAGAGMIPPGDRIHPATHLLALLSSSLWPQLTSQLLSETGIDNGYRQCGGLLIGSPENLQHELEEWTQCGVVADLLDREELLELEPSLNPEMTSAISLPMQSQVRNPHHLQALSLACRERGVRVLPQTTVESWEKSGERILAAVTPKGLFHADEFVIAAGSWSSELVKSLNLDLQVRPIRGQIILLKAEQKLFRRTIEQGKRYLVPRDDGRILVGATEEDAGFEKATHPGTIEELRAFATGVVPGLKQVSVEQTWAGLRPFCERKRPWIGRPTGWSNLILATGHHRAGLSNSPGTSRLLRQLILGQPTDLDLAEFLSN